MPADVIGTPLYVTASDVPVSGLLPTATPTVSNRFDPVVVTVWLQLTLDPLNTDVPPAPGPTASNATTLVAAAYVKPPASVPLCVSAFVTVTLTAPAACAGVVAVIVVPLTTVTPVAALPPTLTVAPVTKLVPVIVTAVPPAVGPDEGATLATVGAAAFTVRVKAVV